MRHTAMDIQQAGGEGLSMHAAGSEALSRQVGRRHILGSAAALGALAALRLPLPAVAAPEEAAAGMVGTWIVTATPAVPPGVHVPEIKILALFTQDGGVLESEGVPVLPQGAGPATPPQYNLTTGFGRWAASGANEYVLTVVRLLADQKGRFAGIGTVRGRATLSVDGTTMSGPYKLETLDARGMALQPPSRGTVTGLRVSL